MLLLGALAGVAYLVATVSPFFFFAVPLVWPIGFFVLLGDGADTSAGAGRPY